jgi:hypothetical protein
MSDDYSRLPAIASGMQRSMDAMRTQQVETANRLAGRYDAAELFKHLIERVRLFQNSLSSAHEVGLQVANFGKAAEIHIRTIGYKNPNLIEFSGVDMDKSEVTLVQHISQLNLMLIAVKPVEEQAFRIGFT